MLNFIIKGPNRNKNVLFILIAMLVMVYNNLSYALPIDWHGVFGVDSTLIDSFRRIDNKQDTTSTSDNGSFEIPLAAGIHSNTSWQSYVFKLMPTIIINDSATFFGELTTGYGNGGLLGDNSVKTKEGTEGTESYGNALYHYGSFFPGTSEKVILQKFYMELYSDTTTYLIGRHTTHWGLGAILNSGERQWDRFASLRDGITLKFKIGNFFINPFWAKNDSRQSLTRATNQDEFGISLLYDNIDSDISFGFLYAIKETNKSNTNQTFDIGTRSGALNESKVKLLDLYFSKSFEKFSLQIEVPIFSGEIGGLYHNGSTKYKAKAILFESNYKLSQTWKVGFHAGKVGGDQGSSSSFEAMYLHPNYSVANLLFKYNLFAVSNPQSKSVYDAYVTNSNFLKLSTQYLINQWSWNAAVIYALAEETAKEGQKAYNHQNNKQYDALANQSDKMGVEVDFGFKYKWNDEISINSDLAYLFTGDYFGFSNTETPFKTKNSYMLQIGTSMKF